MLLVRRRVIARKLQRNLRLKFADEEIEMLQGALQDDGMLVHGSVC